MKDAVATSRRSHGNFGQLAVAERTERAWGKYCSCLAVVLLSTDFITSFLRAAAAAVPSSSAGQICSEI